MSYVLTPSELETLQARVKGNPFDEHVLEVHFTTTREFLTEVLPPCFTVPEKATGFLQVGRATVSDRSFHSSTIYLSALFEGRPVSYDVTMILNTDMGICFGREMDGECKKQGEIEFDDSQLPTVRGVTTRNGVALMEYVATLGENQGATVRRMHPAHLKAIPNSKFTGLYHHPILVTGDVETTYETFYTGTADLTFRSSETDPCGDIPIESVDEVTYGHGVARWSMGQHPLEDTGDYLPYVLGRSWDLTR
ncbi:acetoacetate decarboxylase family protein [Aeromicrobium choanae]|uniref:Acetoacetate decarboxylase (ADC) n=1 Tax=Aeromicrobium choanae TaxID=1736691 RepID=A0A1T4Z305_9ACTN|nr:acetoacetate decarboxylase family protein [Aeromicrobium choanae]SKB08437.1 Acetoacetate decarboxylase (ADC) [Aeromicrobium choanae]